MQKRILKHHMRDFIIALFVFCGFTKVYCWLFKQRGPLVRIVVFHDVSEREWAESMIVTLKNAYNVITPKDFYAGMLDSKKINVLLTFDDGYQSWVDVVLPVLQKHNVQGIFFINSGLVDVAHNQSAVNTFMEDNLRISPKRALSWEGVRTLVAGGQTIGGHTRYHTDLTRLQDTELEREIADDKRVLEGQLSQVMNDFAYPFGTPYHLNKEVTRTVRGIGYVRAYTAISRFVSTQETFMISRMCIETGLSPRQLGRWVEGGYDLFTMIKNICVR